MAEIIRRQSSIISAIKNLRKVKINFKVKETPMGVFEKCLDCGELISKSKIKENSYTCPQCDYHFNISSTDRIELLLDKYKKISGHFSFVNPIDFPEYKKKYRENKKKSKLKEGILTVLGDLEDIELVVVSLDNRFFMGSMGTYIGEEVARAFEYAERRNLPIIIFSTSGGARMQEGIFSLMQMAKTSIAVERYHKSGNLYISCMTNPTTGGVTASFASLGDIILAEPKSLIGFAGARVIKETIKGELPEGFQRAEFLKEKGFLDEIVHRKDMKNYIYKILKFHGYRSCKDEQ